MANMMISAESELRIHTSRRIDHPFLGGQENEKGSSLTHQLLLYISPWLLDLSCLSYIVGRPRSKGFVGIASLHPKVEYI